MTNCDIVLGIDLGTTYSTVAYVNEHGKAEIIPNREGDRTMPSVVLFDNDTPIVGEIAKRSAVASPLNMVQFVKRQMGDKDWRFLTDNDQEYTAEQVSALILKRLKEDAETHLDCEISRAVITVPAYFNDAQRKATQDAGKIADLDVLRVINEPTAAALAYGLDQTEGRKQTIMVYDLGGGTFDVTILEIADNDIAVKTTGGDKNLGGFDWDNKLMEYLNEEFQQQGGIDLMEDPALEQDLRDKAEIAKKTLSSRDSTKVFLSAEGKTASVEVTLKKFQEITADLLERTESLIEMTMEDAKLDWGQIDKILLVGGSTRMQVVPELIEKISGKKPSQELHQDEIVAMGAALLGGLLMQEKNPALPGASKGAYGLPPVTITDVNSHSLGVIALDTDISDEELFNSIILPKDSKIPTKAGQTYYTVFDKQTEVEIKVTEGEDRDPEYVHIVGKSTLRIPPYPKNAPIEVFFEYDDNGIIHVTVFDKTVDKLMGEMHIERESNLSEDELETMKNQMSTTTIQ